MALVTGAVPPGSASACPGISIPVHAETIDQALAGVIQADGLELGAMLAQYR
jgi:hypothetical protein